MPASRVTSRRLNAAKLRSSSSRSAAATMARRVASLRSSRDSVSRDAPAIVTCWTGPICSYVSWAYDCSLCETYHNLLKSVDEPVYHSARCTHVHSNFDAGLSSRVLASPLVDLLTGPHGVDRYTELVTPTWTQGEARAKVVAVARQTPRSVTLTLEPNRAFTGFRAGQHINLTVEIDGRRRTRCYSPASAEGARYIELTIGLHDGGLVSTYLFRPRPPRHDRRPRLASAATSSFPTLGRGRILFVSGGSGITPVMSMLRTLRAEGSDGEVAFVHYARSSAGGLLPRRTRRDARRRVLHGYTRSPRGRRPRRPLRRRPPGRRDAVAATRSTSAVRRRSSRRCASTALMRSRRASSRRSSPSRPTRPAAESSFADSGVERHRRRPAAARAGRGRRADARKRMPDGHLPQLHPPQDPRRGAQPDHRRGVERRRGGRADLRVRPRRRRRPRALKSKGVGRHDCHHYRDDGHTAAGPREDRRRQDRHADPRAGRGVRPRARRAEGTRASPTSASATPPTSGESSRRSAPSRSAAGHCCSAASSRRSGWPAPRCSACRRSSTTWRSATTSCTASTTGWAIRRSRAAGSNGTPPARATSGGTRTTTCTTPTPTSSAWTATSATASCG